MPSDNAVVEHMSIELYRLLHWKVHKTPHINYQLFIIIIIIVVPSSNTIHDEYNAVPFIKFF